MNRASFYHILLFLLVVPLPCMAMEQAPKTPSPRSKNMPQSPATPESLIVARVNVYNRIYEAVLGRPERPFNAQDLGESLLNASAELYVKHMYEKIRSYIVLPKGVTFEKIEQGIPEAEESIEANSFEKNYYDEMSSPLKKEALHIFNDAPTKMHLLKAEIEDYAYVNADTLVVNEQKIQELASTPRGRGVLLKHERAHMRNKDQARKKAATDIMEELRKSNAPSVMDALTRSKQFSPGSKNALQQIIRVDEAFADVEGSSSPISAAAAMKLWKNQVEKYGDGTSEDHPSEADRLKISQAMLGLHKATRASMRKRRVDTDDFDSHVPVQAVSRRLKFEEIVGDTSQVPLAKHEKVEKNK